MLDHLSQGYGFGQQRQSYCMHQESWQNGYQGHSSGMPNSYFTESPQLSTHQMMMFHGNYAMHQDPQQNMHQQNCIASTEKYGRLSGGYGYNSGVVASAGGQYPNMIASSEYESFSSTQQSPPTMRFEAMRYEHSDWGGNAPDCQTYHDGFNMQGNGCQILKWVSKGL